LSAPRGLAASPEKRTAQVAASAVAILRRRPALLRWAIPLGAVAAGVLVSIGIYEQRSPKVARYSDTVVARRETPATPAPMLDQAQSKMQEPIESKDKELATAERSVQKKEKAILAAPSPRPAEGIGSGAGAGFVDGKLDDASANKKAATTPAPAPEISAGFQAGAGVGQNAPVRAAAPSAPPPPAPMGTGGVVGGVVSRQKATSDVKTVPPSASQSVTVQSEALPLNGRADTDSLMLKQGVSNELAESAGSLNGLILTPNNRVFWKLQPAGTVQLTTDGGKDWKSLETGANEDLTTGFAPSSNVCWIAGRSGTLLLTKDRGTHWSRINTPIAGDLGGVHAADAKHASIWDATRHTSYETSDGGSTWKQTTNQ
jgi:hypothetical protein